ncbi:hypothetical protein L7F22_042581 [Adiantum nelumboides]|nr:hypothetical protein [Adiantum nelumboides]
MADRPDDVTEEVSSSQGQQTHEVGESSRPPQTEDEIFRTQLVAVVIMFTQVMQNPRFMALLQPPPPSQPVGTQKQKSEPFKAQPQEEGSLIQIAGQLEEANSIVLDLLKCYVSEHKGKWEQYLPLVEYAYKNTVHSSTDKAPFEIVEGGKKVPPILHTKDKIFGAHKYVQDMDEMYKKVKVALEKTQAKQKKAADYHRREVVFSLGDWVLLHFEKARLKKMKGKERLFSKLSMHYYGHFQICDIISDVAYRLKLPESWKIHNAFHVSLLRPYVGDVPEDIPAEDQPRPRS